MKSLGKYDLLDKLGEGSMGMIYRARDQVLDRDVALKTLSTGAVKDAELLERFYREARACAKLHHPNIVTIYDFGREKDVAYIVMELLAGSDLKKIIANGADMPLSGKLRIMAAVSDGLAHAHSVDIVHRDIKPSNIFVCEDGQPRILDFGVAHMPMSSLTIAGRVLGTPHYMSPEQLLGQACDGRSDIFSTAIVTFEFVAGRHPFGGKPVERITEGQPDSLDHCPAVTPELDALLQKALSRDPANRYASVTEFASALRHAGGTITPPTGVHERTLTNAPPRPARGTETILSAVLLNLQKFEDAADRGDVPGAREALAAMKQAGAEDSRYAVALAQSANRLAELENVRTIMPASLTTSGPVPVTQAPVSRSVTSPSVRFDPTVLFDTYVALPAPPRRRVPWLIWAGVLALAACFAVFLFTRRTDDTLESLPASVAAPSVSQTPANSVPEAPDVVKPPLQPRVEPRPIAHPAARPFRAPHQLRPVEVQTKPPVEPVLDQPPANLLAAWTSVAPAEPPLLASATKSVENMPPPPPPPLASRAPPDLQTQRKAGQELFQRMLARLGEVDAPPALTLSGTATLWIGGNRTDWSAEGTLNVTGQVLTLEIEAGDLRWRTSLNDGMSKAQGSSKLKNSSIASQMERLSRLYYDYQPAVLAARFKAAGPGQMLCDLSIDKQGDRVLQVQAGADRYRVLIAPDGTPLRLHVGGLEIVYASFNDIRGYLYPETFAVRSLAANAPPANVLLFDTVKVVPTLFGNAHQR